MRAHQVERGASSRGEGRRFRPSPTSTCISARKLWRKTHSWATLRGEPGDVERGAGPWPTGPWRGGTAGPWPSGLKSAGREARGGGEGGTSTSNWNSTWRGAEAQQAEGQQADG